MTKRILGLFLVLALCFGLPFSMADGTTFVLDDILFLDGLEEGDILVLHEGSGQNLDSYWVTRENGTLLRIQSLTVGDKTVSFETPLWEIGIVNGIPLYINDVGYLGTFQWETNGLGVIGIQFQPPNTLTDVRNAYRYAGQNLCVEHVFKNSTLLWFCQNFYELQEEYVSGEINFGKAGIVRYFEPGGFFYATNDPKGALPIGFPDKSGAVKAKNLKGWTGIKGSTPIEIGGSIVQPTKDGFVYTLDGVKAVSVKAPKN